MKRWCLIVERASGSYVLPGGHGPNVQQKLERKRGREGGREGGRGVGRWFHLQVGSKVRL